MRTQVSDNGTAVDLPHEEFHRRLAPPAEVAVEVAANAAESVEMVDYALGEVNNVGNLLDGAVDEVGDMAVDMVGDTDVVDDVKLSDFNDQNNQANKPGIVDSDGNILGDFESVDPEPDNVADNVEVPDGTADDDPEAFEDAKDPYVNFLHSVDVAVLFGHPFQIRLSEVWL